MTKAPARRKKSPALKNNARPDGDNRVEGECRAAPAFAGAAKTGRPRRSELHEKPAPPPGGLEYEMTVVFA
jgi:hypothetical protein